MALVAILVPAGPAVGAAPSLTDDEMCELTPTDGNWAIAPGLVDSELSILGMTSHDVSVPNAVSACSNRFEYFDGTNIVVGVYLMPTESDAQAALAALKSNAEAAATVIDFARPVLGNESWVAQFEFSQLAFTRSGNYLIGGMSDEAYDYSRADYSQLLIERMGVVISNIGSVPGSGAGSSDADADTGADSGTANDDRPFTPSDTTDEGNTDTMVIGAGLLGALAVAGAVTYRRGRRRRPDSPDADRADEHDEDDDDRSVVLELTHPVGRSPHVLQHGWLFGARCIVGAGTPEQRDLSDSVRWSGPATFDPPIGSRSRPSFLKGPGPGVDIAQGGIIPASITLSVEVDGRTIERTFPVSVISAIGYARVSDKSKIEADAHGCPACPHPAQGPITVSSNTDVLLFGLPVATVGDQGIHAACCGSNTFTIISGDPRVLINGKPAAWQQSEVEHCGGVGHIFTGYLT